MIALAVVVGFLSGLPNGKLPATFATASDFFPLEVGTRYTFEQRGTLNSITTDEVMKLMVVGGVECHPVYSYESGRNIGRTFYRIEGDTVLIVAYDKDKPFKPPMPVFRFNGKETTWDYKETPTAGKDILNEMKVHGVAKLGQVREVLGKKVETLEVQIEAEISGDGTLEKSSQTTIYGKGIGLVSSLTKSTIRKKTVSSDVRLVKIDSPSEKN